MTKQLFFAFLTIFLILSCGKDDGPTIDDNSLNNSINKIMPLGASRVEGNRPDFESYRYELWKLLIDGNWDFDFIGSEDDSAFYPDYSGLSFDNDHEGRGGWTSGDILGGINDWLDETGSPDIVLFSSPGGNDALQGLPYDEAIANINEIIDALQVNNPNVTIIMDQFAPARSDLMTPQLTSYFEQINEDVITIASEQSTNTSSVLIVDMATDFEDSLLADDVHYNEAGATFVASRYYNILVNILN